MGHAAAYRASEVQRRTRAAMDQLRALYGVCDNAVGEIKAICILK